MTADSKMTISERRTYLRMVQMRYRQADRKEKGRMLDEMEAITKLHRKSLVRLLKGDLMRHPRRRSG